jgi:hypothetical protein
VIRDKCYATYFNDLQLTPVQRLQFWLGYPPENITDKLLASITALLVQFILWKHKFKKKIPMWHRVKRDLIFNLMTIYKLNKDLCTHDINYDLSRNFDFIVSDGLH